MTTWIDASCILIVLFSLNILATDRIVGMIRIFALQSLALSFVPLFLHVDSISAHELVLFLGTLVLKAILVPYILLWAIRRISIRSEVTPIIGVGTSLILGALLIAGAFWVSLSLKIPGSSGPDLGLPCSLATVLIGFLVMVTRTRAVTQVIGYMVIENGIFLFALSLFDAMPIMIEMGILLDIFVAVFIMAIVLNHINEEFEHDPGLVRYSKTGESR
jgi:hydrogenase-4 component E